MTETVKMVTMEPTSYEDIERTLAAFALGFDGDGARSAKWKRILRAATELFSDQGFRKTSVDEIARRAQVAKGTVYLYFETKVGLLLHTIVEEKKTYISRLRPALDPSLAPAERLRRYLRLILSLAGEMPLVSRVLSGDRDVLLALEEAIDPDLREQMFQFQITFLSALLDGAARPHDWTADELRDRAAVILGLLYSAGFFVDDAKRVGLSQERLGELLADMLVDGVGHSPAVTSVAAIGRGAER